MRTSFKYFMIFTIGCMSHMLAQQVKIDSIQALIRSDKPDTNKLVHLNDLAWEYKSIGNYDTCTYYANEALQLATDILDQNEDPAVKLNAWKNIASAYNNLRSVYYNRANYPQAIEYALKALTIYEKIADKKGIGSILGNIGIIYWHQGDHAEALDYYFRAMKIVDELGDKNKTGAFLGNIGIVYFDQGDYQQALSYYLRSLKIKEELGYRSGIANTIGNIGLVYDEMAKRESSPLKRKELEDTALAYYNKALKMGRELDDRNSVAAFLSNIGSLYVEQKKFTAAREYLQRALSLSDSLGSADNVKRTYNVLSALYETSNIQLPDSAGGKPLNMEQMRLKALYYHKRYVTVRNMLFSAENKEQLVRKGLNFEFAKKEAASKAERDKKNAVAEAERKKHHAILLLISCVLFLIAVAAILIFRSLHITRKQKSLIEQQKQIVEEHQKEVIDSIYYARRIQHALLPTDHYIGKNLKRSAIIN